MKFSLISHCPDAEYYAHLSDDELRAEIEAIEKIPLQGGEMLAALECACQEGIGEIRKILAHRKLVRMISSDELVTQTFRERIDALIVERALKTDRLVQIIQNMSNGRVRSVSELTEFEAMVLLHVLGGAS